MPEFETTVTPPFALELTSQVAAAPVAAPTVCTHTREAIKQGDVFVVCHTDGQIHPACECGQGLYYRDTRFLSGLTFAVEGHAPLVLGFSADHNFFSRLEAMNEAWESPDQPAVKRETIHIGATRLIDGSVQDQLTLQNFNPFPVKIVVSLELRADFKDLFEVRGFFARTRPGTYLPVRLGEREAELRYEGADGRTRHTCINFDHTPIALTERTWEATLETGVVATFEVELPARGGRWSLNLTMQPGVDGSGASNEPPAPIGIDSLEALQTRRVAGHTRFTSPHGGFETFMRRGIDDLLTLCTPTADGPYPTAGIPWYACPFGRDGLFTALQSLPLGPDVAVATLRFLARHQGTTVDGFRDEEPGKIMHELRQGELSELGEAPFSPYYGTIDATPLWLVLLSETYRWTGDLALLRGLWPNALRALSWLDDHGDADGDGFVEYERKGDKGLNNQGWKDSVDSVVHPDGTWAEAPIALAEVQGYVYDAKVRTAELARLLGDLALADRLETEAAALKTQFNEAFWVEEGGYYAIALDGRKQRVLAKTSNPGHGLWSGIIADERVAAVTRSLVAPDMFNGWGIRTMSDAAPNYNPMSYHNGSVWPHDATLIAKGMAAQGFKAEANRVFTGLFEAAGHFEYQRLPELFCGFERADRFAKPVPYPVACSPQAWAAGAPLMLLQAALGLVPDAARHVLTIEAPELPDWLPAVTLTGLRVGAARIDLSFSREDGHTRCHVGANPDDLRVVITG